MQKTFNNGICQLYMPMFKITNKKWKQEKNKERMNEKRAQEERIARNTQINNQRRNKPR